MIPMKKILAAGFKSNKQGLSVEDKIAFLLLNKLPEIYLRDPNKVIPFVVCRIALMNHKIRKSDAKALLRRLKESGHLAIVRYKGFRINWNKISDVVARASPEELLDLIGPQLLASPAFQLATQQTQKEWVRR